MNSKLLRAVSGQLNVCCRVTSPRRQVPRSSAATTVQWLCIALCSLVLLSNNLGLLKQELVGGIRYDGSALFLPFIELQTMKSRFPFLFFTCHKALCLGDPEAVKGEGAMELFRGKRKHPIAFLQEFRGGGGWCALWF